MSYATRFDKSRERNVKNTKMWLFFLSVAVLTGRFQCQDRRDFEKGAWVRHPTHLIYIKAEKSASSTTGGIARRIARNHGLQGFNLTDFSFRKSAGPGVSARHGNRRWLEQKLTSEVISSKPIFWFTSIRDPLERCLSEYYHNMVAWYGIKSDDFAKIRYLKSTTCTNFYYNYFRRFTNSTVAEVLASYDAFVMVERYDESLVLLASALGVPLSDVLFLPAKTAISNHVPLRSESRLVRDFAKNEFRRNNVLDYEIFSAVSGSITEQLRNLDGAQEKVREYRSLLADARRFCPTMCSWNVQLNFAEHCNDCLWRDNGCGYKCFDDHFR